MNDVVIETQNHTNANSDYSIFEELAYKALHIQGASGTNDILKYGGNVYAFDSTTIELCIKTFKWVLYRKNLGKESLNVHTLSDIKTLI